MNVHNLTAADERAFDQLVDDWDDYIFGTDSGQFTATPVDAPDGAPLMAASVSRLRSLVRRHHERTVSRG